MIELPDPSCARIFELLDGVRTEAAVIREAEADGVPAGQTSAILAALRRAGLILDARAIWPRLDEPGRRRLATELAAISRRPDSAVTPAGVLRRRRAAKVLVTGTSQLVVPIAAALAAAGVGRPWPELSGVTRVTDTGPGGLLPSDVHRPRGVAAVEAVRRAAPEADLTPLHPAEATFVVLVGSAVAEFPPAEAATVAHLAVTARDATMIIGPLVRPGSTPCLSCLDLHRRDRDPAWPLLAAQLSTSPDAVEPVAVATALAAVAYAAAEVLRHIDGGLPRTLGTTVELAEPGQERCRRWSRHPHCECANDAGTA
jgi:bacteriocin biosynthesis cyclodehydratase domain-containing protein